MSNLPTYTHLTWSYVSWKYTNNTKCKIAQSVHVSSDVSQAENTRIAQNVKSPNMHTSENIFLELKIHVHDRSTTENTWINRNHTKRALYKIPDSVSIIVLCQNTRKPYIVNSPNLSIFCDFKIPYTLFRRNMRIYF